MQLRDYQKAALERFQESTSRSILFVAPTGAGKGTIATALISRLVRKGKRVLFMVHRREIVHDIERRLHASGIKTAQTLRSDRLARVVSVQSLMNAKLLPVDVLIVDEAHHYAADAWRSVLESIQVQRIVGFTATPQRADGRPLGDMFEELVDVVSYTSLLRRGFIVPCRVLRPQAQLENELAQDPVEAYMRYAPGSRALIFVRRVVDAQDAKARLCQQGIRAEYVTGDMKKDVRDDIMMRLEKGEIQAVANVGVLTEGVDVPHITHVILARVCTHASTYLQIVGRALRAAEGKREAVLIDLVGASHVHGLPGQNRMYSLDGQGIEHQRGQRGDNDRPYADPIEYGILDMELEEIEPMDHSELAHAKLPEKAKKKKRVLSEEERKHKCTPRTRPLPLPITPGFIFQDKETWSLGWHENGKRSRLGLATRDKAEAERLLEIFRQEGAEAVRFRVRQKRRQGVSIWEATPGNWKLRVWNEEYTDQLEYRLFTGEEDEADTIKSLFLAGKRKEAVARIERNRQGWDATLEARNRARYKKVSETVTRLHAAKRAQGQSWRGAYTPKVINRAVKKEADA